MFNKEKYKLTRNIGQAKSGDVYVQGLHGMPDGYPDTRPDSWWWEEGSKKSQNRFFHDAVIKNEKIDEQQYE